MSLISTEIGSRLDEIEAKFGPIGNLDGYHLNDEKDLRASLVLDLMSDIAALEAKPHQLLLFRDAVNAAFTSVFRIMNIAADQKGGQQAGLGDLVKKSKENDT